VYAGVGEGDEGVVSFIEFVISDVHLSELLDITLCWKMNIMQRQQGKWESQIPHAQSHAEPTDSDGL